MLNMLSKNLLMGVEKDPYTKGTVLTEKSVAGTYSVSLETGVYEIYCIGGGGGGSNSTGGGGAGIKARAKLLKGTYSCVVGAAGAGAGAYVRNNDGAAGGASSINGTSATITANGGAGRRGRRNGGGGGTRGVLSFSFSDVNTVISRTTDNENSNTSFLDGTTSGPGAGGIAQSNDKGAGYAGTPGYVKITYYGLKL